MSLFPGDDSGQEIVPHDIQYVGLPGISADCRDAVLRIIQFGDRVEVVRILTSNSSHCLILTINGCHTIAVKSGFGSGYSGEGSKTFSFILSLLETHGAEIEEYQVKASLLERLDRSALEPSDCSLLNSAKPVSPVRWQVYVLERHAHASAMGELWEKFPPVIPFSIIDGRLTDLALRLPNAPDEVLITGYRRLEDIVRARCNVDEHGAKLFGEAFNPTKGPLVWKDVEQSEQVGRMSLFTGAYMAFRNPRAHKERDESTGELLSEFLMLNMLFRLEKTAVARSST